MIPNTELFRDYIFYDIETFKHDAMIVMKDINKQWVRFWLNDFDGLEEFIKGKTLVSYNGYDYDDYILTAMMYGYSPEQINEVSKKIIEEGIRRPFQVSKHIHSIDCMRELRTKPSLKKLEANLGKSVKESSVPFDIDRKLTAEEIVETVQYCEADTNMVVDIFKLRYYTYFKPKEYILSLMPPQDVKWLQRLNTTTLTTHLMTQNQLPKWSDYRIPEWAWFEIPKEIDDYWHDYDYENVNEYHALKKKSMKINDLDCEFTFGSGGLHGVNKGTCYQRIQNVHNLDVASMYPNIIINIGALGKSTDAFEKIVQTRLDAKHRGDKDLADALKIVINSVYGLMNNEYSKMLNPFAQRSVCIYGQIALFDLCAELYENGCRLININTDGVAFTGDDFMEIKEAWEEKWNLTLELDNFEWWYQKDVNNYVAKKRNGGLKVKGGDVNSYGAFADSEKWSSNGTAWYSTNSCAIVDIALVERIANGKRPRDTIRENLDNPILYQIVLQAGKTYLGTFDSEGNKYNNVNRAFAVKDGIQVYKKRPDGGLVSFPNLPNDIMIYNDDLTNFTDFKDVVNTEYYIELANKKCRDWGLVV